MALLSATMKGILLAANHVTKSITSLMFWRLSLFAAENVVASVFAWVESIWTFSLGFATDCAASDHSGGCGPVFWTFSAKEAIPITVKKSLLFCFADVLLTCFHLCHAVPILKKNSVFLASLGIKT